MPEHPMFSGRLRAQIRILAALLLLGTTLPAVASDTVLMERRPIDASAGYQHDRSRAFHPPVGIRNPQRFDPRRDVDVGVILPPEQLEHWRSNYVPDSYRLNGYDGVSQGKATVCRHNDGSRTYTTAGVDCSDGNANPPGGRTWSTN